MFSGLYDEIQVLSSTNLSTYYTLISRRLKCLQRKASLGVLSQDQIDLDGLTELKKSSDDSNQNIEYFETAWGPQNWNVLFAKEKIFSLRWNESLKT